MNRPAILRDADEAGVRAKVYPVRIATPSDPQVYTVLGSFKPRHSPAGVNRGVDGRSADSTHLLERLAMEPIAEGGATDRYIVLAVVDRRPGLALGCVPQFGLFHRDQENLVRQGQRFL